MSRSASPAEERLLREYFEGWPQAAAADLREATLADMRANPYWAEENLPNQQPEVAGKGEIRSSPNSTAQWFRGQINNAANLARTMGKDYASVVPWLTDASAWVARKVGAPETAASLNNVANIERSAIDWGAGMLTKATDAVGVHPDFVTPEQAAFNELVSPLLLVAAGGLKKPAAPGRMVKLAVKTPPRVTVKGVPAARPGVSSPSHIVPSPTTAKVVPAESVKIGGKGLPESARYRAPLMLTERGVPRAFEARAPHVTFASSGEVYTVSPWGTVSSPSLNAAYLAEHEADFSRAANRWILRQVQLAEDSSRVSARKAAFMEALAGKSRQEWAPHLQRIADEAIAAGSTPAENRRLAAMVQKVADEAGTTSRKADVLEAIHKDSVSRIGGAARAAARRNRAAVIGKEMLEKQPVKQAQEETSVFEKIREVMTKPRKLPEIKRPPYKDIVKGAGRVTAADAAAGAAVEYVDKYAMGNQGRRAEAQEKKVLQATGKLLLGELDNDQYLQDLNKAMKGGYGRALRETLGDIMLPGRWFETPDDRLAEYRSQIKQGYEAQTRDAMRDAMREAAARRVTTPVELPVVNQQAVSPFARGLTIDDF